jgi:histidinol-phosphate aminotransferase
VQVYTSPARPLVAGQMTYEECPSYSEMIGTPVRTIPHRPDLQLDLDAMVAAAKGAGMVFLNNPNNPTATVLSCNAVDAFIEKVLAADPQCVVLIDEAYHDYVTDPGYATAVPLALLRSNVIVSRTLSKAYGMAGLRVGYAIAQPRTVETFNRWAMKYNTNTPAVAAAVASLGDPAHIDAERARNTEARAFTTAALRDLACSVMESQTNFVFVETGRPAAEFKEACAKRGVLVGREFPPLETMHARISIGTIEEMRRATAVFAEVLGTRRASVAATPAAAGARR